MERREEKKLKGMRARNSRNGGLAFRKNYKPLEKESSNCRSGPKIVVRFFPLNSSCSNYRRKLGRELKNTLSYLIYYNILKDFHSSAPQPLFFFVVVLLLFLLMCHYVCLPIIMVVYTRLAVCIAVFNSQ